MDARTALLVGASGLVGSLCLEKLLQDPLYGRVTALVRRPLPLSHEKLVQVPVDFDRVEDSRGHVRGDDLFFCLGTTLRRAGSKDAFRRVDLGYAERIARIASENKVRRFLLVSSQGADPRSPFFYPRVKGETEEAVSRLPFQSVHIFRPSLLLGVRRERRWLEVALGAVLRLFSFLMVGPLDGFRPVRAERVAEAMLSVARSGHPGVHIYEASFLR
jgi:uncharacterized protein YbjT (DUF2867 family)